MIEYNDLKDEDKRKLKEALKIERMNAFYLEDHGIILMNLKEMFDFVYLEEINKIKEAITFIIHISEIQIEPEAVGKSVQQILLENHEKVIYINGEIYAYRT